MPSRKVASKAAKKATSKPKAAIYPDSITVRKVANESRKERWDGRPYKLTASDENGNVYVVTGFGDHRDQLRLLIKPTGTQEIDPGADTAGTERPGV